MLRAMTKEDLDEIVAIDSCCFPLAWNKKQYEYELDENDYAFLYVLKKDDKIIGFIDYWVTFDIAQLAKIAILPEYRGRHFAHELMDYMIQDVEAKGCENLSLEVRISNHAAQKLYEAYDFINVNTRKGYYQDNHEDAYVLIKALGGGCL